MKPTKTPKRRIKKHDKCFDTFEDVDFFKDTNTGKVRKANLRKLTEE